MLASTRGQQMTGNNVAFDYDWLIIGSGFGGSVSALRLAEKGYQVGVLEAWANIPTTAHILGGAVIGRDAASGVVDQDSRLFGYRNFLVCDGSTVPANPGVNPSLTITAMSEYAMSRVPAKGTATTA
jgi:choline dehydrogenase-like flavoprotein